MARLPNGHLSTGHSSHPVIPGISRKATELAPRGPSRVRDANGSDPEKVYYFDQLIDHSDPSKGTFKARYWIHSTYYERGGPIILTAPSLGNGDSTLQSCSI